jgi:hypothetical protein
VEVLVSRTPIGQAMDQPWIAVEGKNDGFVSRE